MKFRKILYLAFFLAISVSCNTGIERTAKITPTRADRQLLKRSPEEILSDSILPLPLRDWHIGKEFMITDNRAALIYEVTDQSGVRAHGDSLKGLVAKYAGVESRTTPAGGNIGVVVFSMPSQNRILKYVSRKTPDDVSDFVWSDLPMMIDLQMVNEFNSLLSGRRVWTRTSLWYDNNGESLKGAKFIPVTITDVQPGNGPFPLSVKFSDGRNTSFMPMNMSDGKGQHGSRYFASLFSLSDPRRNFPAITPEVWELICVGKVQPGMTKEECKLAIGSPQEVESGHNWNSLVDYWKYSDGTYLLFIDDKLVDNKHLK